MWFYVQYYLVFNELELSMSVKPMHDGRGLAAITKLKPRYQQDVDNVFKCEQPESFPSL